MEPSVMSFLPLVRPRDKTEVALKRRLPYEWSILKSSKVFEARDHLPEIRNVRCSGDRSRP